jgi:hypothetical protein
MGKSLAEIEEEFQMRHCVKSTQDKTKKNTQENVQASTREIARRNVEESTRRNIQVSTQDVAQQNMQASTQDATQQSMQASTQDVAQQSMQASTQDVTQQSIQASTQDATQQSMQGTMQERVQQSIQVETKDTIQRNIEIEISQETQQTEEGDSRPSLVTNIFFYFTIVGALLSMIAFASGMLATRTIAGFRLDNMTTASMVGVYPEGSLLVVKEVPAKELRLGDDIVYYENSVVTVTHRISEIREEVEAGIIFTTKGVNGPDDETEVVAAHVIGRVDNSIPQLGTILGQIDGNLQYVVLAFIVFMISAVAIKLLGRKD